MSGISVKKINDETVKPIKLITPPDDRRIKGGKLFADVYANIFLVGKKKSGKTSVIFKILDKCAGKNTKIIIFASTVHKDANWLAMLKHFKDKKISIIGFTSIFENNVNNLEVIQQALVEKAKREYEQQGEGKYKGKLVAFDSESEEDEDDPSKKEKYLSPEYILVFDDLSTELKDPTIQAFLKKNRHFMCKTIISTQAYIDLEPSARTQEDYLLLFPKIPEDKLKVIHRDADISIDYEEFLKLYFSATKEPFNFLYIGTKTEEFRKNFNLQYDLKE